MNSLDKSIVYYSTTIIRCDIFITISEIGKSEDEYNCQISVVLDSKNLTNVNKTEILKTICGMSGVDADSLSIKVDTDSSSNEMRITILRLD